MIWPSGRVPAACCAQMAAKSRPWPRCGSLWTNGPRRRWDRMLNLDLERYARDPKREFTRLLQMVRYGEL